MIMLQSTLSLHSIFCRYEIVFSYKVFSVLCDTVNINEITDNSAVFSHINIGFFLFQLLNKVKFTL